MKIRKITRYFILNIKNSINFYLKLIFILFKRLNIYLNNIYNIIIF